MPKALKSRERVPAMANPHKSERTRACGGKTKIKSVPKGVNKKNFATRRRSAGTGNFSHEDTKARRFFGRVAKATQTCRNGNEKRI